MAEVKTLSRSEREAQIKDKAGWVITVIALLLAVTTYVANGFSSKILTNTIKANDTWNFYQAKSIKQSIAEGQLEDAKDPKRREQLEAKIARYESDPAKGEGKKELMAKALQIEAERDDAKKHTPWLTFAGMSFQLAIVLLSASILAVDKRMYWGSIGVSVFGALLLTQGIWLIIPFVI
tara:strand:- start:80 stop:616 length:537 start_codon:yes stop_codon:yes gene_type:complete